MRTNLGLQWDSSDISDTLASNKSMLPGVMKSVLNDLEKVPQRRVLDFLVQYFVSELNW